MPDAVLTPAAKVDPSPLPATPPLSADEIIDVWFKDHFVGTILAGTTELYNLALAAKNDLKARIAKI